MLQWYKDRNGIIYSAARQDYIIAKAEGGGVTLTHGVFPNYKHLCAIFVRDAKRMAEKIEMGGDQ